MGSDSEPHRHRRGEVLAERMDRGQRMVDYACAEPDCPVVLYAGR